jgi:hypothetical protein
VERRDRDRHRAVLEQRNRVALDRRVSRKSGRPVARLKYGVIREDGSFATVAQIGGAVLLEPAQTN